MKTAFAYVRVSSTAQVDGTGLDRQEESIRAFAKANGYKIVQVFSDKGVSGTTDGVDRPGLADLANALEEGITVIVENADRLARDLLVSEVILGQFRETGVPVFDCSGIELTNIDGDSTRTLIRQVLGAVAEFNKTQLVQRLKASRERIKAKEGRCEGRKPYDNQKGIQRILQLRAAKVTYRKIPEILEREEIPAPSGGKWHVSAISRIVKENS